MRCQLRSGLWVITRSGLNGADDAGDLAAQQASVSSTCPSGQRRKVRSRHADLGRGGALLGLADRGALLAGVRRVVAAGVARGDEAVGDLDALAS